MVDRTLEEKIELINAGNIDQLDISEVLALLGDLDGSKIPGAEAALRKAAEKAEAHYKEVAEKLGKMNPPQPVEEPIEISKEELTKNVENLEILQAKSYSDKEEFKNVNKALDNLEFEAKNGRESFVEAVKLKTFSDCITVNGLDETKYIQALKTNIEQGIFALAINQAAADKGYEPKASKEAVQATINKLAEKPENQPKIRIGVDNLMGFIAATAENVENKGNRLLDKFADIPAVKHFYSKLSDFDQKMSKRYGKNYARAKGIVKYAGTIGMGVGLAALAGTGMGGLAIVGAYSSVASIYGLNKQYRSEAAQYNNSFSAWAGENKLSVFKSSAMFLLGVGTAGFAGSQVAANIAGSFGANVETFKAAVPFATKAKALLGYGLFATRNVIDMGVAAYQDRGTGEHKNFNRAAKQFFKETVTFGLVAGLTMGITSAYGCAPSEQVNDTVKDTTPPTNDGVKTPVNGGWIMPIIGLPDQSDINVPYAPGVDPNAPIAPVIDPNAPEFDCGCGNDPTGFCADKILEQQNIGHNDTDIKFWESRINLFLTADEAAKIEARIDGGCIDLDKMPGIDTKEELIYKYAILKENNLVDERILVNWLECGKLDDLQHKEIANAMNSYDNRGNPLCWTPEPIVKEQVVVKQTVVTTDEKTSTVNTSTTETAKVVSTEVPQASAEKTYSLNYKEDSNLVQDVIRKDYDGVATMNSGISHSDTITLENGSTISYEFKDGAVQIDAAKIPMDDYAKGISQQLEGFYHNPDERALQIVAVSEVYNDLDAQLGNGKEIPGAQEWMADKRESLAKLGFSLNEDNYLETKEGFDKETAVREHRTAQADIYNREAQEAMNKKAYNPPIRGKDYDLSR